MSSWMAVSQISLTMAVNDKKSRNGILTENNDWEITVSKNNDLKAVSNGQLLLILQSWKYCLLIKFPLGVIVNNAFPC